MRRPARVALSNMTPKQPREQSRSAAAFGNDELEQMRNRLRKTPGVHKKRKRQPATVLEELMNKLMERRERIMQPARSPESVGPATPAALPDSSEAEPPVELREFEIAEFESAVTLQDETGASLFSIGKAPRRRKGMHNRRSKSAMGGGSKSVEATRRRRRRRTTFHFSPGEVETAGMGLCLPTKLDFAAIEEGDEENARVVNED